MEAPHQSIVAEAQPMPLGCMGDLVARWSEAGASLPVAIVVSVFDDVLVSCSDSTDDDANFDAIAVDDAGHATLTRPVGLVSAGQLLIRALGDDAPLAAQPLVARLVDGDDRPIDGEQLRQWMRDALGPPASREEVSAVFAALTKSEVDAEMTPEPEPIADGDDTEAETLLPAPAAIEDDEDLETLPPSPSDALPVPPLAEDDEAFRAMSGEVTLPPERPDRRGEKNASLLVEAAAADVVDAVDAVEKAAASVTPDPVESTAAEAQTEVLGADSPIPAEPMSEASVSDSRKVVRHSYRPRTASVVAAPAARRSARAASQGPDSILVPNDRNTSWFWLVVCAAIGAVVYVLFFR